MSARTRIKRKDAVDGEVTAAAEEIGASVLDLAGVGEGCPDKLIWFRGRMYLVEVKSPGGTLNEKQVRFISRWPGKVFVVSSREELIEILTC